jgi:hypothetical protein
MPEEELNACSAGKALGRSAMYLDKWVNARLDSKLIEDFSRYWSVRLVDTPLKKTLRPVERNALPNVNPPPATNPGCSWVACVGE